MLMYSVIICKKKLYILVLEGDLMLPTVSEMLAVLLASKAVDFITNFYVFSAGACTIKLLRP